jgi:hypothetical protein
MRETPPPEQRTEWRRRMVEAIIERAFDDETLAEMLMAGFDEAHTEGLLDGADICRDIAEASPPGSRVARVLESALRSLVEMNAMQFPYSQGCDAIEVTAQ